MDIFGNINKVIHTQEWKGSQMETLEELEHRYFMLEMQDSWDTSDDRYADELKEKLKKLREEM